MQNDNPIEKIMETAMDKLRTLVDVNTVIGSPVENGQGSLIVPFSKVSMGFVAGGGEYMQTDVKQNKENPFPFAGGSGAGLCVSPMGFLIFEKDKVKVVNMEDKSAFLKMIEEVPSVVRSILNKTKESE